MTAIWFYHLEHRTLDEVLPILLERTLARGWRAVVQAGSAERVAALDALLWTYRDDSFLPHGTVADGELESQPIVVTETDATPNGAAVRILLDGAAAEPILAVEGQTYERLMLLFDGRDDDAVAAARAQWSALKKAGRDLSYWQQDQDGRWEKRG